VFPVFRFRGLFSFFFSGLHSLEDSVSPVFFFLMLVDGFILPFLFALNLPMFLVVFLGVDFF